MFIQHRNSREYTQYSLQVCIESSEIVWFYCNFLPSAIAFSGFEQWCTATPFYFELYSPNACLVSKSNLGEPIGVIYVNSGRQTVYCMMVWLQVDYIIEKIQLMECSSLAWQ